MLRFTLISFLLSLCWSSPLQAENIRVAVAANFHSAISDVSDLFENNTGHKIELIVGSSGKLAAQIMQGAPYDLFLSADTARPVELEKRGLIVGKRQTYAYGQLVLLAKTVRDKSPLDQLIGSEFERIAMANPDLAPYGRAGQEVLSGLGLKLDKSQLVYGENVSQALHFLNTGNVDLAFVAMSQVLQNEIDLQRVSRLTGNMHKPIKQQMVVLTDSESVIAFSEYILSAPIQELISKAGYQPTLNPGNAVGVNFSGSEEAF